MSANGEAMINYLDYLKRYCKKHEIGIWQAHQHALCRETARSYGLSEEQIKQLDEDL